MKWERIVLIAFFANYIINNVVAGIVSLIKATPGGGIWTAQYMTFILLAAVTTACATLWYFCHQSKVSALVQGAVFGVSGFVIAIATALISGISGVLQQTGSLAQVAAVLPNFVPFLKNWTTLALLGYWVIPALAVGYYYSMKKASAPAAYTPPQNPPHTM